MSKVKIAIECNSEHRASIYALVTSIKANKKSNSIYDIYILTNGTATDEWTSLLELKSIDVDMHIYEGDITNLTGVGKIIYLKWNTLVMGDLSQLYNIELLGKRCALAQNLPDSILSIPETNEKYNYDVLLLDTDKTPADEEYEELSIYFNCDYDKFIKNKNEILNSKLKITKQELEELKDWALILRMDKNNSPEKYFDVPLAKLWQKYYEMSPISNEKIRREATAEVLGEVNVDVATAIPIAIAVDDNNFPYTVGLIESVLAHLEESRNLDIRILYTQLSNTHKKILMEYASKRVSIVLYNVSEYRKYQDSLSYELLVSNVFSEYEKAIYVRPNFICEGDIGKVYDIDISQYWIGAIEDTSVLGDTVEDYVYFDKKRQFSTDMMLVNVTAWKTDDISDKIQELINRGGDYSQYTINELINIVCVKNILNIDNAVELCRNNDKDNYGKHLEIYITNSPWGERLKEEINIYESREDRGVKEAIERMRKLEETNAKLKELNKELKNENNALKIEKNQYLYEILETRKSITYKIGRVITFIPRKLRGKR